MPPGIMDALDGATPRGATFPELLSPGRWQQMGQGSISRTSSAGSAVSRSTTGAGYLSESGSYTGETVVVATAAPAFNATSPSQPAALAAAASSPQHAAVVGRFAAPSVGVARGRIPPRLPVAAGPAVQVATRVSLSRMDTTGHVRSARSGRSASTRRSLSSSPRAATPTNGRASASPMSLTPGSVSLTTSVLAASAQGVPVAHALAAPTLGSPRRAGSTSPRASKAVAWSSYQPDFHWSALVAGADSSPPRYPPAAAQQTPALRSTPAVVLATPRQRAASPLVRRAEASVVGYSFGTALPQPPQSLFVSRSVPHVHPAEDKENQHGRNPNVLSEANKLTEINLPGWEHAVKPNGCRGSPACDAGRAEVATTESLALGTLRLGTLRGLGPFSATATTGGSSLATSGSDTSSQLMFQPALLADVSDELPEDILHDMLQERHPEESQLLRRVSPGVYDVNGQTVQLKILSRQLVAVPTEGPGVLLSCFLEEIKEKACQGDGAYRPTSTRSQGTKAAGPPAFAPVPAVASPTASTAASSPAVASSSSAYRRIRSPPPAGSAKAQQSFKFVPSDVPDSAPLHQSVRPPLSARQHGGCR